MAKVTMYTTDWCGYCRAAKRFLEDVKGVTVTEVDLTHDERGRAELARRTGRTTVPQIFVGDVHVGGYTDLRALESEGRLDALLAA